MDYMKYFTKLCRFRTNITYFIALYYNLTLTSNRFVVFTTICNVITKRVVNFSNQSEITRSHPKCSKLLIEIFRQIGPASEIIFLVYTQYVNINDFPKFGPFVTKMSYFMALYYNLTFHCQPTL